MPFLKSKVLFVVPLPPPMHGVTAMNEFINKSKKINNSFLTRYINYSFTSEIDQIGSVSLSKLFNFIKYVLQTVITIFKFKPNIIYLTLSPTGSAFYRDAVLIVFIKTFYRGKLVYHLHGKGIKIEMQKSYLKSKIYQFIFNNTEVIHLSKKLEQDLDLLKPNFNFYIIPNGLKKIKNRQIRNAVNKDKIKLLYLSNLIKTKGVLILLNSIAKIIKKGHTNIELNLIGKPSKSITLDVLAQKINELKIENYVNYLGPIYGEDKNEYFLNSNIFVFPTYKDCFPLVILEAMQYNLGVVTTNEGAIDEIIDNNQNGFICERKNGQDFIEKLEYLITHPKLIEKFGKKAGEKFDKYYTETHFELNIINTFNKILSS